MPEKSRLISHSDSTIGFDKAFNAVRSRIKAAGNKPHVTVARQLEILEQLSQFGFGRFLIEHQGINGYWTHYMLTHPWFGGKTGLNDTGKPLSEMERFLLEKLPLMLATQERFQLFLQHNQTAVKNGAKLACIPCGMMGELLYLDFDGINNIELIGIDYDAEALNAAKTLAKQRNLSQLTTLQQKDAWQWQAENAFDLISSNGLNIYEPDAKRIVQLYQTFYRALKPGGKLVTSFITPPPTLTDQCEWDFSKINQADLLESRIIFVDVLNAKFQCYYTTEQTRQQLHAAGFTKLEFIADRAGMFPTVIAQK